MGLVACAPPQCRPAAAPPRALTRPSPRAPPRPRAVRSRPRHRAGASRERPDRGEHPGPSLAPCASPVRVRSRVRFSSRAHSSPRRLDRLRRTAASNFRASPLDRPPSPARRCAHVGTSRFRPWPADDTRSRWIRSTRTVPEHAAKTNWSSDTADPFCGLGSTPQRVG